MSSFNQAIPNSAELLATRSRNRSARLRTGMHRLQIGCAAFVITNFLGLGIALAAGGAATDVEAATRAYIDTLAGPARASSDAYFEGGYWLQLWGTLVTVLANWILLCTGTSARFGNWARRLTTQRWLVPALYAVPYMLAITLITFPWTIYARFVRETQYGLMSQGFAGWLGDRAIGLGIMVIVVMVLVAMLFSAIRLAPTRWWLWGATSLTLLVAVGTLITPVYIAPLFNTYTELPAGPVRESIAAMAKAHDVPTEHIYLFDQSKQDKRISANVAGLGPTIRISLNDNLLNQTSAEETIAAVGHELGHYVLGHAWWLIGMLALVFLAGFWLLNRLTPAILARRGKRWGICDITDPASTPLFAAMAAVLFFVLTPVMNNVIRSQESAADMFGLNAACEPDGFAGIAMKLSNYRKIEPSPLEEFLFFDHPSGATRVRMAMQWKADNSVKPVACGHSAASAR